MSFWRPRLISKTDQFGNKAQIAIIGIYSGAPVYSAVGPLAAVRAGADQTWGMVRLTGNILGQFLTGQRSVKEMGGPIKIAKQSGEMATLGIGMLIFFIGFDFHQSGVHQPLAIAHARWRSFGLLRL